MRRTCGHVRHVLGCGQCFEERMLMYRCAIAGEATRHGMAAGHAVDRGDWQTAAKLAKLAYGEAEQAMGS